MTTSKPKTSKRKTSTIRAVRLDRVCEITGASRTTIWRWVKSSKSFPQPFNLSQGVRVWDEVEIFQWIAAKKQLREGNHHA